MKRDHHSACVLVFHRVRDRVDRPHDVRWSTFHEVIDTIANSGIRVGSKLEPDAIDQATALLTFDDGTIDHIEVGKELAARNMPGIFFISTGKVGALDYVESSGVREIASQGHTIGSHGVRHEPLTTRSQAGLVDELRTSKLVLENLLGSEVRYFAPPGGIETPALSDRLQACGYSASRSMRWGVHSPAASRWAVPVLPITEFTVKAGWISIALQRGSLPLTMRTLGLAKGIVRPSARNALARLARRQ